MRKLLIAGAVIIGMSVTGCGDKWHGDGVIVARGHHAATFVTVWNCYARNKYGACTLEVPSQIPVPESWDVTARDAGTGHKHTYGVSEDTWQQCPVGRHVTDRVCGG